MQNGSIETDIPEKWLRGKNLAPSDGRDCGAAHSGVCSWKFTGNGTPKWLTYVYQPDGSAGDTFDLSAWRKAIDQPGSGNFYIKVIIKHLDGSNDIVTLGLLGPGDLSIWGERSKLNFTATEDYRQIVLQVIYTRPSGTVWVDDLSLVKNDSLELMQNGSIETDIPEKWLRGKNLAQSDGRDCGTAHTGACAWKFTGNGTPKWLTYVYQPDGSAGDTFDLSAWRKAIDQPATGNFYIKVIIKHQDGSNDVVTLGLLGSELSIWGARSKLNFTASEDYRQIVLQVIYTRPSGTAWVDDVSLSLRD